MNDKPRRNGNLKIEQISINNDVSRETANPIAERISALLIRRAEDLCANASVLTDQTFLPIMLLVEIFPSNDENVRRLGQVIVAGPAGVDNANLIELVGQIAQTINQAQAAQQGVTEGEGPETKLGDPAAAQEAMTRALTEAEQDAAGEAAMREYREQRTKE